MKSRTRLVLSAVAAAIVAAAAYAGCAAGQVEPPPDVDDGNCAVGSEGCACTEGGSCDPGLECLSEHCVDPDGGGGKGGAAASNGSGGTSVAAGTGGSGLSGCAEFTVEAEMPPAAMLVVLDKSASMTGAKWTDAKTAVKNAIDQDVFDTMALGLVTYPTAGTAPPQCICQALFDLGLCDAPDQACCSDNGVDSVSCGSATEPDVAIALAGTAKTTDATGVRHDIAQYLTTTSIVSSQDDGSPIYEAMSAGYDALAAFAGVDYRMLLLITDGGFSCTSLSARPGYDDDYGCPDWEYPDTVNTLITTKRTDATTPISTFVVGVPGSNSSGDPVPGCGIFGCATPPYQMRLALSTYAVSGSPDTVDPACDDTAVFTQGGPAPAVPCHIDLSMGTFDANVLADAIAEIRGAALGCVYPLPEPPPGESLDLELVNVSVTLDGDTETVPKRSDPSDTCELAGCWDYQAPDNDIVILGASCDGISQAGTAKVDIVVGCETIVN